MIVFPSICDPCSFLPPREVHVYVSPLTEPEQYANLLTPEEQTRAQRFRLARVRSQFIAARGLLRMLLGKYLRAEPADVPIRYADGGKPYVPGSTLHFNLSHTDGLGVFAVARTRVGIDVEKPRPVPDALNLVQRFFTVRECALFNALPEASRLLAFFRAWTRKEAILKAIGRGVQALDCCDVTFCEDESPRVVGLEGDDPNRWHLSEWEPAKGYMAALAVEDERGQ